MGNDSLLVQCTNVYFEGLHERPEKNPNCVPLPKQFDQSSSTKEAKKAKIE